jgi:hypothetical protein
MKLLTNDPSTPPGTLFRSELLERLVLFRPPFRQGRAILKKLKKNLNHPQSLFTIQHLRDYIFFSPSRAEGGKVVGFASPREDTDAVFLALLVGLAFGGLKHNRVVFVDGRFDRRVFSMCSRMFNLSEAPFQYMNGCGSFNCYSAVNQSFSFLTGAGNGKIESLEVFSNDEVAKLIAELRQNFDYVIFDMPPVMASSETRMLLPRLDLFFLNCTAGLTRSIDVKMTREIVTRAGGSIAGAVVTGQRVPFWASMIGKEAFL